MIPGLANLAAALATVGAYASRSQFIAQIVEASSWDCRGIDDVTERYMRTWRAGMRASILALRAKNALPIIPHV